MTRRLPLITAHSGCMGSAPNGPEHIRRALASGADIVELDIRLSADGRVVLSHDDSAPGPDGAQLPLQSLAWDELRALRGEEGAGSLLDLDGALDLLEGADVLVNLDAKEPEAAIAAARVAARRGAADSVLFSGLEPEAAALVRVELAAFPRLLNADLVLPASGYGLREMRSAARTARECGCCGINLDFRAATEALMEYALPRCLPIFLWTADDAEDLVRALALRPHSITTNRPDLLAGMIADLS